MQDVEWLTDRWELWRAPVVVTPAELTLREGISHETWSIEVRNKTDGEQPDVGLLETVCPRLHPFVYGLMPNEIDEWESFHHQIPRAKRHNAITIDQGGGCTTRLHLLLNMHAEEVIEYTFKFDAPAPLDELRVVRFEVVPLAEERGVFEDRGLVWENEKGEGRLRVMKPKKP